MHVFYLLYMIYKEECYYMLSKLLIIIVRDGLDNKEIGMFWGINILNRNHVVAGFEGFVSILIVRMI